MKFTASLFSLTLVAPLAFAGDRHPASGSLARRRHVDRVKRDHAASYSDGPYGSYAEPHAPAAATDAMASWSSTMAGHVSTLTVPTMATPSASSYDTANWAPSYTASTSAWGAGGDSPVDSCVQQCMASHSMAWPATSSTTATAPGPPAPSASATGGGAEGGVPPPANDTGLVAGPGQVIVAPKKGDLRMVPFNIAAKPGETIEFVWGAGPHTVTQSSAASICNASQETGAFKSGMQNATFRFPVQVKDESPVFYYCAVASHCRMGMFGLINGKVSLDGKSSFGTYMKTWANKSAENQQMWDETVKITVDFPDAASWGEDLSTDQFEDWALPMAMESTLMTRQFLARTALAASGNSSSGASPSGSSSSSPEASASASTSGSAALGIAYGPAFAAALGALMAGLLLESL